MHILKNARKIELNRYIFKNNNLSARAFTLVELLVVIVIIGILATIAIVSYSGIQYKAIAVILQNDLDSDGKLLKMYNVEYGYYPDSIGSDYCPTAPTPTNKYCLKASSGNELTYSGGGQAFTLIDTHTSTGQAYKITESGEIVAVTGGGATSSATFIKAWGPRYSSYGNSITNTSDGGYAIAGQTSSYVAGYSDEFISKYDTNGNQLWMKTWGSNTNNETANSIIQTSDGGFAVTGNTKSYGAGNDDMFIIKYDSSGNVSWNKTWGGTGLDRGNTIIQTSDGGYAVTGETYSYSAGSSDMFIVKYDSSGNISWNKIWGGVGIDRGNSIVQTSDGGYAITGETYSYGAGSADMFVVKYDNTGSVSWNKTWGGNGIDFGTDIIQTSDGGYAVTGETESSFASGTCDMIIVKYDGSGNISWNNIWGGTDIDAGSSIIQSNDGGYVVTGDTYSSVQNEDVFIVKYDSSGNISWNKTWGGIGNDWGYSIVQNSGGGYAVTGSTSSFVDNGIDNVFLAKYDSSGNISGCSNSICRIPTVASSSPTITAYSPTSSTNSPAATVNTPTAVTASPSPSAVAIVSNSLSTISFAKAWGGDNYDYGTSIARTSDGGYVVTGETDSYDDGSHNGDMFIAKYDNSGNITWNKTWGGPDNDYGASIVQTSDGGYAITGETLSYGSGNNDMFIAKYDSSGNLSWNKTWGGSGDDLGVSIEQTNDSGYIITGRTDSYGAGGNDMFIAKYTSSGTLSWNKTWGGVNFEYGTSVAQVSDNGYIVTGYAGSYGAGSNDMFIAKYDSIGNLSWNKTWGGTSYENGNSIISTTDGGFAITGETGSYGAGASDMFIAKYDSSGNLSWNKTWGGVNGDRGYSLVQTSDSGYIVTGDTDSYGAGSADMFIAKFSSNGTLNWSSTWGGPSYESGYSIIQTSDSGYIVTGETDSYGDAGGNGDMFIAKYFNNGEISNCTITMCKFQTVSSATPSASVASPLAGTSTPTVTVSSPTVNISTPTAVNTVIVAQ